MMERDQRLTGSLRGQSVRLVSCLSLLLLEKCFLSCDSH